MKILKELIFSRVKAYNMVQVFHFLSETLESYYCRKLLSISNRLDTYIALRFQGLYAHKIAKESIIETENKNVFTIKSKTERGVFYTVDMTVGVCGCMVYVHACKESMDLHAHIKLQCQYTMIRHQSTAFQL